MLHVEGKSAPFIHVDAGNTNREFGSIDTTPCMLIRVNLLCSGSHGPGCTFPFRLMQVRVCQTRQTVLVVDMILQGLWPSLTSLLFAILPCPAMHVEV